MISDNKENEVDTEEDRYRLDADTDSEQESILI